MYKGIPIILSADFSAETLQARRGWHDIFKVMKGQNLQARILYFLSYAMENQKIYRQAKAMRIKYQQISFATNVKGISVSGKEKSTTKNKKITN